MKNRELQTVTVKVLPSSREYILAINDGSDVIIPGRESKLWGIIKMHLDLIPQDYVPTPVSGQEGCIRVAIFRVHRWQYSKSGKRTMVVDTLFRNHLTEAGQRAVADYLMHSFKHTFRSYMTGALSNNPKLSIHDAIYNFCELYRISMDTITYEMLRKDWFRFRKRRPDGFVVPIENKDF